MKKIFLALLISLSFYHSKAQSAQDIGYKIIFRIIEQIGEIKYYASILQKGYNMAANGLHIISDIKNREFSLHRFYFDSLRFVKPEIQQMAAVSDIILQEATLIHRVAAATAAVKKDINLHPDEVNYLLSFFNAVVKQANLSITSLYAYTTSGKLSMNDGERIAFIQQLYQDTRQLSVVVGKYIADIAKLSYARTHDKHMNESLQKLYGL